MSELILEETFTPQPSSRHPVAPTPGNERTEQGKRRWYDVRPVLRRPGLVVSAGWLLLALLAAVAPRVLTSRDPLATVPVDRLQAPSWRHLFGTDELGRDLFSRTVHGADLSLRSAFIATVLGLVGGALLGLLAGFFRGWVDTVIMRIVDVVLAIPSMLASLALVALLGIGTFQVALAVGFTSIAMCARVTRAEVLRVRQSTYVEAAHASGNRTGIVLARHVVPNSLGPVFALAAVQFGVSILAVSSLSFLGYGAQPPTPEWGALISGGRDQLGAAWWLTTLPGVVVVVTVLAMNHVAHSIDGGHE